MGATHADRWSGAIGADLVHAIPIRHEPHAFWLALLAFLLTFNVAF
jgi:hypothetical protein